MGANRAQRRVRAAVDRRHEQIELGTVRRAGEREANRMKQRRAPSARSSASRDRPRRGTSADRRGAARPPALRPARRSPGAPTPRFDLASRIAASFDTADGEYSKSWRRRSGTCSSRSTDVWKIGTRLAEISSSLRRRASRRHSPHARDRAPRARRDVAGRPPSCSAGSPRRASLRRTRWARGPRRSSEKAPRHFLERHQLLILAWRPAQQRQVVQQRLGQIALRAKLVDRHGAMALRQLRVIGPEHHRHVREREAARSPSAS